MYNRACGFLAQEFSDSPDVVEMIIRGQGPITVKNSHLNGETIFVNGCKITKIGTNKLKLDLKILLKICF